MSGIFRFKQFDVDQTGCSMKVNTDGVLLGALASAAAPTRVLDIGTGTGVIALMLAQRFPQAAIDAIEIDPQAAATAARNFRQSVFAPRLACHTVGLADFEAEGQYDLLVSNPPYFLDSLKNPDQRKSTARHTDWSFFERLLSCASRWLTDKGSLQLILPIPIAEELCERAARGFGLFCQWRIDIHSFEGKAPVRCIAAMGRDDVKEAREPFMIYAAAGQYSDAYRRVLRDFFLAF